MKLAIIGAGALGTLFGAYLAPYADVTLVSRWTAQIDAIRTKGLKLMTSDGETCTIDLKITDEIDTLARSIDVALVLVKSYDSDYAARVANTILKPSGIALTLQNGLGNVEKLAAVLGENRAVAGVTTQGATLIGVGVVKNTHTGMGDIQLAEWTAIAPQMSMMNALFKKAGFPSQLTQNLDTVLWGKLVINVGINALTAIFGERNRFLADEPSARKVLAVAVTEAVTVAKAKGIVLPYANPVARVVDVARATGETRSSMLSDVVRHRRTEVDAINGAIVREGKNFGVETPVNETLTQLVLAIEAGYQIT